MKTKYEMKVKMLDTATNKEFVVSKHIDTLSGDTIWLVPLWVQSSPEFWKEVKTK